MKLKFRRLGSSLLKNYPIDETQYSASERKFRVGKTTFSQYLVRNLGSNDVVSSPTYALVNEYQSPKGKIFHFDLYRVNEIEEVFDIGIGRTS